MHILNIEPQTFTIVSSKDSLDNIMKLISFEHKYEVKYF